MLRLENIRAGYGGGDVVRGVSFDVAPGESFVIIGPNGCGKTTLLKAIAGLLPSSGRIEVNGTPLAGMKQRDAALKIAMLGQISQVYFSYTVYETVMMGRYAHVRDSFFGIPSKADRDFVEDCLGTVCLLDEKERDIGELSGGQLQRVFLARALAQDPQVILLDEPTNHLDLKHQIELLRYLKEWSSKGGRAVVGVLHDLNLAVTLADRVMLMRGGEAAAMGKPDEVLSADLLSSVYGTDVVSFMSGSLDFWQRLPR